MKILAASLERRVLLVDTSEVAGKYYRAVHPETFGPVLEAAASSAELGESFFYSEDGSQVYIGLVDANELSPETEAFIASGWANMAFAGVVWVAVVRTTSKQDEQFIAFEHSDKARVQAVVDALNAPLLVGHYSFNEDAVHVIDPDGDVHVVSGRYHGDDDDSVYTVVSHSQAEAVEFVRKELAEDAAGDDEAEVGDPGRIYIISNCTAALRVNKGLQDDPELARSMNIRCEISPGVEGGIHPLLGSLSAQEIELLVSSKWVMKMSAERLFQAGYAVSDLTSEFTVKVHPSDGILFAARHSKEAYVRAIARQSGLEIGPDDTTLRLLVKLQGKGIRL